MGKDFENLIKSIRKKETTFVDLSNRSFTNDELLELGGVLHKNRSIQRVVFSGTKVDPANLMFFYDHVKDTNFTLTSLELIDIEKAKVQSLAGTGMDMGFLTAIQPEVVKEQFNMFSQSNISFQKAKGGAEVLSFHGRKLTTLENIPWGELVHIKDLNLQGNLLKVDSFANNISLLTNLKALRLGHGNPGLAYLPKTIISPPFQKNLKMISLTKIGLVEFPRGLLNMEGLVDLDIGFNPIKSFPDDLPKNLGGLTSLGLEGLGLTTLPPEIYNLTNLERLNLSKNQLGPSLPIELFSMIKLKLLLLVDNEIESIPPEIKNLNKLKLLVLDKNQLTYLPNELGSLARLERLSAKDNKLTSIGLGVCLLNKLQELDISSNQICSLPDSLGAMKGLKEFRLFPNPISKQNATNVESIPKEVLEGGEGKILAYYQEMAKTGKKKNYNVKLMFVGNGNVGKTTLLNILQHGKKKLTYDAANPNIATDGIDISEMKAEDSKKQEITFSMWDFAGQEVYYSTHQFFISSRSLYLLVFNLLEDEITSKFEFWFSSISAKAKDSPVIIVGTHLEDKKCTKQYLTEYTSTIKEYKRKYDNLEISQIYVSSETGRNIDQLRELVLQVAGNMPHIGEILPGSYFQARERVQALKSLQTKPVLSYSQFESLANDCQLTETSEVKNLLQFLHNLGEVVYFDESEGGLDQIVVLDSTWLANVFATVITMKPNSVKAGILKLSDVGHIWKEPDYPPEHHEFLLALLERYQLIFLFEDHKRILIPALLPEEPPPHIKHSFELPNNIPKTSNLSSSCKNLTARFEDSGDEFSNHSPNSKPYFYSKMGNPDERIIRVWELNFLPQGTFSQVIVRLLQLNWKAEGYWKYGLISHKHPHDTMSLFYQVSPIYSLTMILEGPNRFTEFLTLGESIDTVIEEFLNLGCKKKIPCPECLKIEIEEPTITPSTLLSPSISLPTVITSSTTIGVDVNTTPGSKITGGEHSEEEIEVPRHQPKQFQLHHFSLEECEKAIINRNTSVSHQFSSNGDHVIEISRIAPEITMTSPEYCDNSDSGMRVVPFSDIEVKTYLDEGSFAKVFLGEWKGEQIAVKQLNEISSNNVAVFSEFRREAWLMSWLRHPNLVELKGICLDPFCLLMEIMDGGSLFSWIDKRNGQFIPWKQILSLANDIALGMNFLHTLSPPVIHRDLKSPNVLLQNRGDWKIAKISDFGLSRSVALAPDLVRVAVDNPTWLAPEVLKENPKYDFKSDVYAWGIMLWEIVTVERVFPDCKFMSHVADRILKGERPHLPEKSHPLFTLLIEDSWCQDSYYRPTFAEGLTRLSEMEEEILKWEEEGCPPLERIEPDRPPKTIRQILPPPTEQVIARKTKEQQRVEGELKKANARLKENQERKSVPQLNIQKENIERIESDPIPGSKLPKNKSETNVDKKKKRSLNPLSLFKKSR